MLVHGSPSENASASKLVCNSVDANVNQRDGSLQDIEERRQELTALGLYDDMSTWTAFRKAYMACPFRRSILATIPASIASQKAQIALFLPAPRSIVPTIPASIALTESPYFVVCYCTGQVEAEWRRACQQEMEWRTRLLAMAVKSAPSEPVPQRSGWRERLGFGEGSSSHRADRLSETRRKQVEALLEQRRFEEYAAQHRETRRGGGSECTTQ
ncbi:hypothetical protein AK812_SmicGene6237 [Symbiodinium microadriaticum]|uniref:Uncharacterized protein n=1 Tax=Symbiodinium microadriaticum TaxID=2951 RepID=A0A1Q9ERR4_SYMMI|nr:hypothetical protein AK812_SmicGene6237 [Symbiodinium microadriaticum]